MAYQISDGGGTPHATSPADLLAKLKTFVLAQGGISVGSGSGEEWFKLTGGGSDEIFFGIKLYENAGEDNYAWILQGALGYNAGLSFDNQSGCIPVDPPALALWNSTIPYWFFCSSRRVLVVAKLGTVYTMAHLGFLDRIYGYPTQWPYPLLIGGSTYRGDSDNSGKPYRYSVTNGKQSNFWFPLDSDSSKGSMCLRDAGGTWQRLLFASSPYAFTGSFPYLAAKEAGLGFTNMRPAPGGDRTTHAIKLILGGAAPNQYGELGSIRWAAGTGLNAEATLTEAGSGDVYIAFPNVFRVGGNDFCVVKRA